VRALSDPPPVDPLSSLAHLYIYCTDKPGRDSFAGFAATARNDPTWRFDELPTGHDAMITAPRELAALLTR
jgi:hypothetical protein